MRGRILEFKTPQIWSGFKNFWIPDMNFPVDMVFYSGGPSFPYYAKASADKLRSGYPLQVRLTHSPPHFGLSAAIPAARVSRKHLNRNFSKLNSMKEGIKKKEFDTLKTFRAIKEKISKDISDMSVDEIKDYLKGKKIRLQD